MRGTWVSKGKPSRRGLINVALTRADDGKAAAVQTEVVKALGRVGEGAEIIVEPRPENEITGAQIRAARELLGWARDRLCPRAGLSATLLGKIEDGLRTPTNEQRLGIQGALEAAGIEFTNGDDPAVKLGRPGPQGGLGP